MIVPVLAAVMYLSIPINIADLPMPLGTGAVRSYPACALFETKGAKEDRIILVDDQGAGHRLIGPWKDFMFDSLDECKTKAIGQAARIQGTGINTYRILLPEKH